MLLIPAAALAQDGPVVYANDFEGGLGAAAFEFSDPAAWRVSADEHNAYLELFGQSEYATRVRSPFNIAVLKSVRVGSFVLEADLKQTGREYDHRDLCLFFAMKDPTNYYYVHLASVADPNAHNIFIVNDAPRRNIAEYTTDGADWGDGWHKVRLEHDAEVGSIRVFFDDMTKPIMEATDQHFDGGYVGFGSFDDTGLVDNIMLRGEKLEEREGFFR